MVPVDDDDSADSVDDGWGDGDETIATDDPPVHDAEAPSDELETVVADGPRREEKPTALGYELRDPEAELEEVIESDPESEPDADADADADAPVHTDAVVLPVENLPPAQELTAHTGSVVVPLQQQGKWVVRIVIGIAAIAIISVFAWAYVSDSDTVSERDRADKLEAEKNELEKRLTAQLGTCTKERGEGVEQLTANDKKITKLETQLGVCQSARSDLEGQQKEVEQRLSDLSSLTKQFSKMIDTGDLSVKIRRGLMMVELPSAVLFPSGKAQLSKKGTAALKKVAAVLKTMPKRTFMVAGHTDSVPVKQSTFKSNWELSAARAVTVTEALIAEGVAPGNLVAAGYGQHAPVASNKSRKGRRANRRIEIILQPVIEDVPADALAKAKAASQKTKKGKKKTAKKRRKKKRTK